MKKISIIATAFNEESNVLELYKQLNEVTSKVKNYIFEYIFIENGSTDNTFENLLKIKKDDPKIIIVKLSRNFGFDGGMTAGLDYVDSDATIVMTANLQDNPKVIPDFITMWEEGYEMVYGIVKSRPGKSILRKINSKLFYIFIKKMTKGLIPQGASDYRLIDKKVVNALKNIREANRFYRGFFSWVGFKSIGVEFERQKRFSGKSKAQASKVLGFALRGAFAFSNLPLKISIFFTFIFSIGSIVLLSIQIYRWINFGVPFDGYGTIIGVALLVASILFGVLSIMGQYISLIFDETKNRPIYIIDEVY